MNSVPSQPSPSGEVVWSCVEDGFYVSSRTNRFLGFVDRVDAGAFQVCDRYSQQIGLFETLEEAQDHLLRHSGITGEKLTETGAE